ncbi:MAG: hypothetical protein Q9218_003824 [Villophora microphyllina]
MASTASSRIWEAESRNNHHVSQPTQLPSITNLTNTLPSQSNGATSSPTYPPNNRDSDQWPSAPQSTRSSAYSSGVPSGYYAAPGIASPHRASNSSQFAATSHPSGDYGLPTINQHHDPSQYRGSHEYPGKESRRSSIGSEVGVGQFRNLQINSAPSPYTGPTNQSTTSIQANLQRERGIAPGTNGVRNSRASGNGSMHHQPMSPLGGPAERQPGESRQAFNMRNAPIISANPMKEVYNADKPTAGQPYAFPDPDLNQSSGSNEDPRHASRAGLSRRNSDHTSINSSLYTDTSRQTHRTIDGDSIPGTHHHSLQHRQVSQLTGESDSPDATSPYSRTPALRASHKLAERKRRTEMKHLFDGLRNQIPASHGSKSSKWEILSKASEYITALENNCKANQTAQGQLNSVAQDLDAIRRENESLRAENQRLYHEMNVYRDTRHANLAQPPMPPHYDNRPFHPNIIHQLGAPVDVRLQLRHPYLLGIFQFRKFSVVKTDFTYNNLFAGHGALLALLWQGERKGRHGVQGCDWRLLDLRNPSTTSYFIFANQHSVYQKVFDLVRHIRYPLRPFYEPYGSAIPFTISRFGTPAPDEHVDEFTVVDVFCGIAFSFALCYRRWDGDWLLADRRISVAFYAFGAFGTGGFLLVAVGVN